jgi:hypothetical protein
LGSAGLGLGLFLYVLPELGVEMSDLVLVVLGIVAAILLVGGVVLEVRTWRGNRRSDGDSPEPLPSESLPPGFINRPDAEADLEDTEFEGTSLDNRGKLRSRKARFKRRGGS